MTMSKRPSLDEIRRLRHLMVGDWRDKAEAAKLLKEYNPEELPIDIMEVWEDSDDAGMRYLALQVEAAWFSRRHSGFLAAAWMVLALVGLFVPPLFLHLVRRSVNTKKSREDQTTSS
jgi:hypothetical protein